MTAGVATYFMGLGSSGADARQMLYDIAYPRVRNGDKVVWNGVDSTQKTRLPGLQPLAPRVKGVSPGPGAP